MHNTKIDHLNYGTYAKPNEESFKNYQSSFSNEIWFSSLNQKDFSSYNFASNSTEQPAFYKRSNSYTSYAFANEKSYYDLDKQQDLSKSSVINDNYNVTEFKKFGDEDLYNKSFHTDLISNNTTGSAQLDRLSAIQSSSDTFISNNTYTMSNDEYFNDLFQGFLNYSPEELFDHLSPQEMKLFDEKSHEIRIDSEELDIFTQPQRKKRKISVITNRKSTYPSSRCSRILTDFPLNNINSFNRFSSNSFLRELYFHSGRSPSDSENHEKSILSFTKNAKNPSNVLASRNCYSNNIGKLFEIPVVTVNAVILQNPVTPISEIGISASKSIVDRFVPRSASCQSVYEIPIFNPKTVDTAEERNNNIDFKKALKPKPVSAESSLKCSVKSLSSEVFPSNSPNSGRDNIWGVSSLDTPTFWANCDLKNITLEAPDYFKMAVKPDGYFGPTKIVQNIDNYRIPTTKKNTKIELSNEADIKVHSFKLSFESHTKDETPLLPLKKPGHNRMFKMSMRENPLTSSKPSWYITSYGHSTTANDKNFTSSANSFSDSFELTSKSVSGIPVSSIYFCADKTVKSLFSEDATTGSIVKKQANNFFSKPLENNEEKAVEENIVETMNLKSPESHYKSKYTAQVEHNFVECFKEIDDFVQKFDAKTEIIVSNGVAAAASVKKTSRKTPISLNDCKKKEFSLTSQSSVGVMTKPITSSAPANLNIGSEKKHNVITGLKHSFSKDIDKLKSHYSKDTIFNELLQAVPERSLTERKLTRRHKPTTPYERVIKELTQEIDTLKSMRSRQVLEHMENDSSESFKKNLVCSSKTTGHRKTTSKKTQQFTDSSDNVADDKNESKGGKKLREVLHAAKFKVKYRLTNEKN